MIATLLIIIMKTNLFIKIDLKITIVNRNKRKIAKFIITIYKMKKLRYFIFNSK